MENITPDQMNRPTLTVAVVLELLASLDDQYAELFTRLGETE